MTVATLRSDGDSGDARPKRGSWRPANLLLVDDNPENLVALESILEPLEQNLVKAHSGEEALRCLLEEEFAVILLDVMMPALDGFETAAHIKQREKTRDIPIIFLTAISRGPQHALRGYSAGAVDYISKPFDPWVLRAKVAVFIELFEKNRLLREEATVRKRAEEALQRQLDLYESLLRAQSELSQGVAIVDRSSRRFLYSNEGLSRISGHSSEELQSLLLESLVAPEQRALLDAVLDGDAPDGRHPNHFETEGIRKDGSRIHLEVAVQPIDAARLVALVRDISERKRAEVALREAEHRYHSIFENAVEGILQCTFEGRVLAANPAAARILGYGSAHELMSSSPLRLFADPSQRQEFVCRIREKGAVEGFSLQARRTDGTMAWISLSARGMTNGETTPIGFEGTIADVTERTQLETFRNGFVANAAHELRTPIAALTGFASLLANSRRLLSEEQVDMAVRALEGQGNRLRTLIQNLLDLTQMQQGHLSVRIEPVALATAVKQAAQFAPPPSDKTLQILVGDDAVALVDKVKLEQILINVLNNAYRYGGENIVVEAACTEDGTLLSVTDDGAGVPGDLVPHLFEAFARGRNAAAAGGSGLGLAIVRMLVEACGGLIHYEEASPRGSRFVVRLRSPHEP